MSGSYQWFVGYRRLHYVAFALLVSGMILGILSVYLRSSHRNKVSMAINEEVWVQIKEGMSREQVIDLVGASSGSYNGFPVILKGEISSWEHLICEQYDPEIWTGDEGEIIVCFDETGVVRHAFYRSVVIDKRSMIERVLSCWRWRKW